MVAELAPVGASEEVDGYMVPEADLVVSDPSTVEELDAKLWLPVDGKVKDDAVLSDKSLPLPVIEEDWIELNLDIDWVFVVEMSLVLLMVAEELIASDSFNEVE